MQAHENRRGLAELDEETVWLSCLRVAGIGEAGGITDTMGRVADSAHVYSDKRHPSRRKF